MWKKTEQNRLAVAYRFGRQSFTLEVSSCPYKEKPLKTWWWKGWYDAATAAAVEARVIHDAAIEAVRVHLN